MKTFENAFTKFKQNVRSTDIGMIPVILCYDNTESKFYRVSVLSMGSPAKGNEMTPSDVYQLAKQGTPMYLAYGSGTQVTMMTPNFISVLPTSCILVFYNTYVNSAVGTNVLTNNFVRFVINPANKTVTFSEKTETYDLTSLKKT